jgi:GNAT superfamily N-acetyltransferase
MMEEPRPISWLPPAVAGAGFLRDGTEVWVRPALPSDREAILDFLERESPESTALRTFAAIRPSISGGELLAPSPPAGRLCLLALAEWSGRVAVLGVGAYAREPEGSNDAEIAFLVAGPFRGRGIASLLLARLARAARAFGILRFEVRVLPENLEMLEVFRGSGMPYRERPLEGEVRVLIPLCPEVGASAPGSFKA